VAVFNADARRVEPIGEGGYVWEVGEEPEERRSMRVARMMMRVIFCFMGFLDPTGF